MIFHVCGLGQSESPEKRLNGLSVLFVLLRIRSERWVVGFGPFEAV